MPSPDGAEASTEQTNLPPPTEMPDELESPEDESLLSPPSPSSPLSSDAKPVGTPAAKPAGLPLLSEEALSEEDDAEPPPLLPEAPFEAVDGNNEEQIILAISAGVV